MALDITSLGNFTNSVTTASSKIVNAAYNAEKATFSVLDTAMVALDKLPAFTDAAWSLISSNSIGISTNPIGYLVLLLNKLGVSEEDIKNWLVDFIVKVLPSVELSVKAALLSQLKESISCSTDPFIPKRMRKKYGENYLTNTYKKYVSTSTDYRGLLIDVDDIDTEGMLAKSPYTNGKEYYFDVTGETVTEKKIVTCRLSDKLTTDEKIKVLSQHLEPKTVVASKTKLKWELVRANDFNAFLWMVIHNGKLASPSRIEFSGDSKAYLTSKPDVIYSIQNKVSKSSNNKKNRKKYNRSLIDYLELMPVGQNYSGSTITLGQTFASISGNAHVISMCTQRETDCEYIGTSSDYETYPTKLCLMPVSDDLKSLNWYVDRSNYYTINIGNNKHNKERDYNNEFPICNIGYTTPYDEDYEYTGGVQKLRFCVLPKPYVYFTKNLNDISSLRSKYFPILFNSDGIQDKNGKFSLPCDKTITDSDGYVRPYVTNKINYMLSDEEQHSYRGLALKYMEEAVASWNKLSNIDKQIEISKIIVLLKNNYTKEQYYQKYIVVDGTTGFKKLYMYATIINANGISGLDKFATKEKIASVVKTMSDALDIKLMADLNKQFENIEENGEKYVVGDASDGKQVYLYVDKINNKYYLSEDNIDIVDVYKCNFSKITPLQNPSKVLVPVYKGLTIYEFDYDFIMGMRLFDAKVVVYKLFHNLTNMRVNSTLSVSVDSNKNDTSNTSDYYGNQSRLKSIVSEIIQSDEAEIENCYYTFSNETYESMLQKAEERRYNLMPYKKLISNGEVDLSSAYEILDTYNSSATLNEQKTVISETLTAAIAAVSSAQTEAVSSSDTSSANVSVSFVTDLLTNLAVAITEALLSPKILLIIEVNKQMIQSGNTSSSPSETIKSMIKSIIKSVINQIKDLIIQKLTEFVLEKIALTAVEFNTKVVKDQYVVYTSILKNLKNMLSLAKTRITKYGDVLSKLKAKYKDLLSSTSASDNYDLPTIIDDITYADIYSGQTTTTIDEPSTNC